jgi:hypothetical protein
MIILMKFQEGVPWLDEKAGPLWLTAAKVLTPSVMLSPSPASF